ncbi:MAG: Glyoxylate/hydroxypyruvate reductase A [Alphaproteobacteria bacterium MarineAlpha5_Bin5]|nr:MAG: Glyoxylate/hydroxypyruvate reductase A [Alphaproteobacteria bacterium MarineAlpha5_Bin5]PPR52667.1 MAG: Glyoxylate/hydroxypyruvate reductase A [Alphaproteobacteria bacterium MarineAlpha5_Bin4]|tara:strand:+ start:1479 stop:2411 length:933 start_codon:yes stop_codon:yes gene_type:complete
MNILFYTTFANQRELLKFIKKKFKGVKVFTIKDKVNLKKIEIAMVFNLPNSYFKKLVNLKLIFSLGAGVDHILNSPNYNNKIPIIRMKDPNMRKRMFNHTLSQILYYQLKLQVYQESQRKKVWLKEQDTLLNNQLTIGILGVGYLGSFIGIQLHRLGYNVLGFKNSSSNLKVPFKLFRGNQINNFISQCDILISILPSTQKTIDIINKNFLKIMKKKSLLINIGRGLSLNEEDLINHLKLNSNFYASLDVFKNEPINKNHKFWSHPNITITPHIASITDIESSIEYMYKNYLKFKKNGKIKSDVNIKKGY